MQALNHRSKLAKVFGFLSVAVFALTAVAVGDRAKVTGQPAPPSLFENITLSPNFNPDAIAIRGISGGTIWAREIAARKETETGPCVGFADEQPDHVITLTNFFNYLSLQVESPADTTIIVRGPGGTWCNDDLIDRGKNPGIVGQWQAGTYQVWIGSFNKKQYHPYRIKLSELQ